MNILSWGIKMRFLKYWWRRFITLFENLFKKTQKEQDLDAPAPLKEDLDAPAPANNNIKGNPLFQRDGHLMPSLCDAPINMVIGRVAMKRNSVSVAMANGCVANERHYVSNNNLEENNMGLLQSKPKKPKTKEDFDNAIQKKKDAIQKEKDELRDLEKGRDEFIEKNGIKPIQGEKIFNTSISSIKSMNEDNKLDSDEYKPFLKTPANSNNAKFNEIEKQFQQNGQEIDQLKQEHQERRLNKQEEDMKEVKKDITDNKTRLDKYDIMIAEMKQQTADIRKQTEKMEEDKKAHDELMAALWNKLDEWNGIKNPTREGNDNRESTNTSFSSFKYRDTYFFILPSKAYIFN